jgi:transposase
LSPEQLGEFAKPVETGPDLEAGGVVRWRRADLKRVIVERFGVDYHERTVGRLLPKLGFSPMSAASPPRPSDKKPRSFRSGAEVCESLARSIRTSGRCAGGR